MHFRDPGMVSAIWSQRSFNSSGTQYRIVTVSGEKTLLDQGLRWYWITKTTAVLHNEALDLAGESEERKIKRTIWSESTLSDGVVWITIQRWSIFNRDSLLMVSIVNFYRQFLSSISIVSLLPRLSNAQDHEAHDLVASLQAFVIVKCARSGRLLTSKLEILKFKLQDRARRQKHRTLFPEA